MQRTSNPLDIALKSKNLFFSIQTPNGEKITRAGNFNLDQDGYIVTKEGYYLLDTQNQPIQIPPNAKHITIDQNATVYVDNEEIATIKILQIDNLNTLEKVGDKMWNFQPQRAVVSTNNSTVQGFLERSNVNPVTEMTELIETNRLVERYQKVMTTFMDDLQKDAIEKLGSIKA
jgi:flagellar basal-body rod protein FlgG